MKDLRRLLLVTCVPGVLVACLQQVDSGAALDPTGGNGDASAPASSDDLADASTWALCQSPSCDDPGGTIPFLAQTPVVYLPDGSSTADPCVQIESESLTIRQTYCASCHGPRAGSGQGGFDSVLDDTTLAASVTSSATFPRFVVSGDPYASFLYVSVANGTMPPASATNPVPSAADLSVLYGWIQACLPGPGAGYVTGSGFYGPGYEEGGVVADAAPAAD